MKIAIPTNRKELKHHLEDPLYRNSYFLLLTSASSAILGFFFWMLAARFYTPKEVGIATALISAMTLLAGFSRLGFDIGIIRFLPNEQNKKGMINSCLTITALVSALLALVFLTGLDFWFPALSFVKSDANLAFSFVVFTIFGSLILFQKNVFIAFRKAEYSFAQNITISVLKLVFIFSFVFLGAFGIFASFGIAAIIAIALSLLIFTPKLLTGYFPAPKIEKKIVNKLFHFSFGNYIAANLSALPITILPLLILTLLTAEMTAYFYIAWSIALLLFAIPGAIGLSLFAEGSHNHENLRATTLKAVKFAFLILIPIIIGIFFLGDKLLFLFGKAYSENAFDLLLIFAFSSIPATFVEFYVAVERIRKRVKPIILYYGLIATLTMAISYLLIPRLGIIGAGVGWLSAQSIVAFLIGLYVIKSWRIRV